MADPVWRVALCASSSRPHDQIPFLARSEGEIKTMERHESFIRWLSPRSDEIARLQAAAPVAQDAQQGQGQGDGEAKRQADAHLRALLRYTEHFYGAAIQHGMKAGDTANCVAHVERAGKALHQLVHTWADTAAARLASLPTSGGEPVAWTLTETLAKRETTTRGYLWFSNPQNCMWTPLYTAPQQSTPPTSAGEQARQAMTPEQVQAVVTQAVRGGKLSWLGFKKDDQGAYTIPVLSPSDYQLVRAVEAHHGITAAPGAGSEGGAL